MAGPLVSARYAVDAVRVLLTETKQRQRQTNTLRTTDDEIMSFLRMVLWEQYSSNDALFQGVEDLSIYNPSSDSEDTAEVKINNLIFQMALPPDDAEFSTPQPAPSDYVPINPQGLRSIVSGTFAFLQLRDQITPIPAQGVLAQGQENVPGSRG